MAAKKFPASRRKALALALDKVKLQISEGNYPRNNHVLDKTTLQTLMTPTTNLPAKHWPEPRRKAS